MAVLVMATASYDPDPRVDQYIDAPPGWQQAVCREVRELVHAADPEVQETIKRSVQPYFVLQGNICALLATKDHVNVFLYDGAIVPRSRGHHHGRPRQQDGLDGRRLRGRDDQRRRAAHDVRADHRRQPRRWMASAPASVGAPPAASRPTSETPLLTRSSRNGLRTRSSTLGGHDGCAQPGAAAPAGDASWQPRYPDESDPTTNESFTGQLAELPLASAPPPLATGRATWGLATRPSEAARRRPTETSGCRSAWIARRALLQSLSVAQARTRSFSTATASRRHCNRPGVHRLP